MVQALPSHAGKGGLKGQHNLFSEAKRRAEQLFESSTVAEIREIESKTRTDIEGKKNQLRQLVGDSYRDLIDSADKIVGIASNCESILHNVKEIQQGFSFLAHSFTTADSLLNEKRDSLSRHEELYAVSGRVRYLVDTPEVIWGFLDGQQYLAAAQRLMRAQLVHQQLHANFPKSMLAKFPLLSHQWPVVLKFKQQISAAVQSCLSLGALPLERTADALAALAAMEGLDAATALQQLLAARKAAFRQQLQGSSAGALGAQGEQGVQESKGEGEGIDRVSGVLADATATIQATIGQVGVLFLAITSSSGQEHSSYLQLLVREDEMDVGELLFGGHATTVTTSGAAVSSAPELNEWHKATKKMQEHLVPLSSGVVERTATQWVRELSEEATQHGQALLGACTTARHLVDVESAVKAAIAAWRMPEHETQPQQPQPLTGANATLPAQKRPRFISAFSGAQGLKAAGRASQAVGGAGAGIAKHASSWEGVCESVVGTQMSLWLEVLHPLFMARSKQLITDGFEAVIAAVGPQLDVFMREAEEASLEPAGHVASLTWPEVPAESGLDSSARLEDALVAGHEQGTGVARKPSLLLPWSERLGPGGMARKAHTGIGDKAFRVGVHTIRKQVDQRLHAVLQSALLLLGGDPAQLLHMHSHGSGHLQSQGSQGQLHGLGPRKLTNSSSSMGMRPGAAGLGRDAARAAELEPYIQARCVETASRLSALLHERLSAIETLQGGPQGAGQMAGAAAAEQALLVGRLCAALAWESRYLPVLLGPPEAWRTAAASGGLAGARGAHGTGARGAAGGRGIAVGSKLQAVVEQLRSTAVVAFRSWASWAAHSLTAALRVSLLADDALTMTNTPLSWQETVIPAHTAGEAASDLSSLDDVPMTDMRFSLPACPSAPTQALLQCACAELRRAGDHTAPAEAIQVWEWELLGACLACYNQLLTGTENASSQTLDDFGQPTHDLPLPAVSLGAQLSEKGVLQLLFDVRLLRDVLAGGRPMVRSTSGGTSTSGMAGGTQYVLLDPQESEAISAVTERRKAGTLLEQQLQDRLDPIDWATYEHHLWSAVKHHYQRCLILYGGLTQLHKVHAEAGPGRVGGSAAAGAAAAALNPLSLLPVAPRFQYLPIAVPAGAAALAGTKGRPAGASFVKLPAVEAGSDLAAAYSFADLGVSTRVAANSSAAAAAAAAASPTGGVGGSLGASATHAFGQLQARFGTSGVGLGSLSSLLGDKAAEVTAMAQQRFDLGHFSDFGNALGSAAGGLGSGLLSSLTKGVAKK